jgi:hypothetical protein
MSARLDARNAGQKLTWTARLSYNYAPGLGAIFISSPSDKPEHLSVFEAVKGALGTLFCRIHRSTKQQPIVRMATDVRQRK